MFITIDGPNGVGKTTVAARLAERLRATGANVHLTRQPSGGHVGMFARQHEHELRGWPLAAMVVADRYMQLHEEIEPALASGQVVVCDRYVASTLVLQRLDGLDRAVLREMNAAARRPDLAAVLLATPDLIQARLRERKRLSRFEMLPDIAEREHDLYAAVADDLQELGYRTLVLECSDLTVDAIAERVQRSL